MIISRTATPIISSSTKVAAIFPFTKMAAITRIEISFYVALIQHIHNNYIPLLGTIDGANKEFIGSFAQLSMVAVYKNGLELMNIQDYEVNYVTFTVTFIVAPLVGDFIWSHAIETVV